MFRLAAFVLVLVASTASATERICDPQFEDCREPLLRLIRQETVGIDIGMAYMSDFRYVNALTKRFQAGVPIRILMSARNAASKRDFPPVLQRLAAVGIPMRSWNQAETFHWKAMLFHGQQTLEFSKANYTAESFVPGFLEEGGSAKAGWFDEAPYFTSAPEIYESFRTQFETYWTDTQRFVDYANITTPPVRLYPVTPIDPSVNFAPDDDFNARVLPLLAAEPVEINLIEFRVLGEPQVSALIEAVRRGVTVRLLTELLDTANPTHDPHRVNVNRLWRSGVRTKVRVHPGLTHEGLILLHGLGEAAFGSSNLADKRLVDHNLFIGPQTARLDTGETPFEWFRRQFTGKWRDPVSFLPYHLWLR